MARFTKEERLCSRKAIEILLKEGNSLFHFPFKVTWIQTDFPIPYSAQIALAVPKRKFKRAYQRNLVKRRIREAYRLHKQSLYDFLSEKDIHIQFLVVYIAPEILSSHEIEPRLKNTIHQIMDAVQKRT